MTNPVCLPGTPGGDVVGVITAVGDSVEENFQFTVGDRVCALTKTGGNARYAVVPGSNLVKVPKSVAADDAACVVSTFMAAYQAHQLVCPEDKSLSGKKVLVSGGTGPLGQALIQLARRAGAQKVYTTAHPSHHMYVRMLLGATPLPLEPEEWLPLVEGNMDVVFDSACQDGYASSQKALSDEGQLVCVGMYALLNSESVGLFGAPLSAYWTKSKASYFMSKTQSYEINASFASDPEKFKVSYVDDCVVPMLNQWWLFSNIVLSFVIRVERFGDSFCHVEKERDQDSRRQARRPFKRRTGPSLHRKRKSDWLGHLRAMEESAKAQEGRGKCT